MNSSDNTLLPAVVVVANKAEGLSGDHRGEVVAAVGESAALGWGEAVGVSAETGEGVGELVRRIGEIVGGRVRREERRGGESGWTQQSRVVAALEEDGMGGHEDARESSSSDESAVSDDDSHSSSSIGIDTVVSDSATAANAAPVSAGSSAAPPPPPSLAIQFALAGLPNAGKSSLANALLGSHRCLTGSEPGLTRDAVRVPVTFQGRSMWLVRHGPQSCADAKEDRWTEAH